MTIEVITKSNRVTIYNLRGCIDDAPWASSIVHGRYLSRLESAVRNHPAFQSDPDFQNNRRPQSPSSVDFAFKQLRAMEAEIRARKKMNK